MGGVPSLEEVAETVALHKTVKSVPAAISKSIGIKFKQCKGNPKNTLKVYKALIVLAEKQAQIENFKFVHSLHLTKAVYVKNNPHQCTAEFDKIYNTFLKKRKINFNNGAMDTAFDSDMTARWVTNPNPNEGVWKDAEFIIMIMMRDIATQWGTTEEGKAFKGKVGYENELFDSFDQDYELEQVRRGTSHSFMPQTGAGLRGVGVGSYKSYNAIGYGGTEAAHAYADPAIMVALMAVMVCLCFAVFAVLSVLSCVGGYICGMGRFMGGIGGNNNKNQNQNQPNDDEYENV